ncbi:hypothetical protein BX666DRAFT_1948706 [Dichotomocladium elegans]|nr:hypothetical protein BX666DRAFT_1948706 [Dichotomocladium elegans]
MYKKGRRKPFGIIFISNSLLLSHLNTDTHTHTHTLSQSTMRFSAVLALALGVTMAAATPAAHVDMLKKRDIFTTITTTSNGVPYVVVLDGVATTSYTTSTSVSVATVTSHTTSALYQVDLPLLSVLANEIPIVSEILSLLDQLPPSGDDTTTNLIPL